MGGSQALTEPNAAQTFNANQSFMAAVCAAETAAMVDGAASSVWIAYEIIQISTFLTHSYFVELF